MNSSECKYCGMTHRLADEMDFVTELKASKVYLLKDQTYYGRCVVAFIKHRRELFELTQAELHDYMDDIVLTAKAVKKVSGCQKVNYSIYGDLAEHLHFHIVPKFPESPNWGRPFLFDSDPPALLSVQKTSALTNVLIGELKSSEII